MNISETLRRVLDTVIHARNLNAVRADGATFVNADDFFSIQGKGAGERLLSIKGPYVEIRGKGGLLSEALIGRIYGADKLDTASPLRDTLDNVMRDAYLDRYLRVVLNFALILPAFINEAALSESERLMAWLMFATTAIKRPHVKIEPLDKGGGETEEEDPDDDHTPFEEDEEEAPAAAKRELRFVSLAGLRAGFLRQWSGKIAEQGRTLSEGELQGAFDAIVQKFPDAGYFKPVEAAELIHVVQRKIPDARQRELWLKHHQLQMTVGQPTQALTYETRQGGWLAAIGRESRKRSD